MIYDSYAADFAQTEKEKEKEKDKKGGAATKKDVEKKRNDKSLANEELNKAYLQCWQILERMINQNIFDEIAQGLSFSITISYLDIKLNTFFFKQIIVIMKIHPMNIAKKKEQCYHYGNLHMKKQEK